MTIRQTLFLGFFIVIVIFLLNFFIDQRLSQQVVTNTNYLNNSEEIIRNSHSLHISISDMQNAFRGFLLTGDDIFLGAYYEALKTVPPLLRTERGLLSSDLQKARLDSINLYHTKWIAHSKAIIEARRDTLPGAVETYSSLFEQVRRGEGKRLIDRIKDIFDAFDLHEYAVRMKRRNALRESIVMTQKISVVLTFFSIITALLTCLYVVRIITRRIKNMANVASDIASGNFRHIQDVRKDEFHVLSDALNSMSEKLERYIKELRQKNKELDQFANVVSHDLKAPLRGIDNITKWIIEDHSSELSPGMTRNVELIKGRTKRLENMINALLDYARIGRKETPIKDVDTALLVTELVEILVPVSFEVHIAQNMPVIPTRHVLLEQVFSNLISNAVKYNNKPIGLIGISYFDAGVHHGFSVEDNGPGIPSEYHEKVFVIFQTLKERDAFESTGMGLAIVKKILDEQNCSINIQARVGGGTIFTFTWPKHN